MADDKTKQDARDRNQVSADDDYRVAYFAKHHKITVEQAKKLIKEYGNDRARLERAASQL